MHDQSSPSQRSPRPQAVTSRSQLDLVVRSGLPELDALLGGFKASAITLIDGNSALIGDLPNRLCVQTYHTFHSRTLYIDGGMCANPYRIAQLARNLELDQREVLEYVSIARAFTVYQLATLIHESLEPMIRQHGPRTVVVGRFPALYLDPDVPEQEAATLLATTLETLRRLTGQYRLVTVLTNRDRTTLSHQRGLRDLLYGAADEVVRCKELDDCTYLDAVKAGKSATVVRGASGQLRLDCFGAVS